MTNTQLKETKLFLDALINGDSEQEIFHFQTFDDLSSKRKNLSRVFIGTLNEHFNNLQDLNNKGAGVFVCVNKISPEKPRNSKNVNKIRAVFADKDDGKFESLPLQPTILIDTKNGQHAYWVTDSIPLDKFEEIQKAIINTLRTDSKIKDKSRVMRLPGFYHKKDPNNPYYVKMVNQTDNIYNLQQLTSSFPSHQKNMENRNIHKLKGSHDEIMELINSTEGAVQGNGGDNLTYIMACKILRGFNLSIDEALTYLNKWNLKCKPKWNESELIQKLENAEKYGEREKGYLIRSLTTENWIRRYLKSNNVIITYDKRIKFNDMLIGGDELLARIRLKWDSEGKPLKQQIISDAILVWEAEKHRSIIKRAREIIKYDKKICYQEDQDPISQFTRALVGEDCTDFKLHCAVLKHFVWQVKRKLISMTVDYPICPIIVGKQRIGKSRAVENLINPLKTLSYQGNLGMFSKDNERFIFGRSFIIVLDECAKAQKADLESLKHTITTPTINYRPLFTNTTNTMHNVSTFIGTANKSISEMILDTTGLGRFHEIPACDNLDKKTIGGFAEDFGIDYWALWKSVNENDKAPILEYKEQLEKKQEEIRPKTFVEQWLEESDLVPNENDAVEEVSFKVLHQDFIQWLNLQNCKHPVYSSTFGKELKHYLNGKRKNKGIFYLIKKEDYEKSDNSINIINLTN